MLTGATGGNQYETDRARFLGRGQQRLGSGRRCGASSQRLRRRRARSDLQPALPRRRSDPRQRIELTFLTLAAASREALLALVAKYQRPEAVAPPSRWPGRARSSSSAIWASARPPRTVPGTRQSLALSQRAPAPASGSAGAQPAGAIGSVGVRNLRRSADAGGHRRRRPPPAAGSRTAAGAHLLATARIPRGPDRSQSGEPSYDLPLRQQLLRQIEAHSSEPAWTSPAASFCATGTLFRRIAAI